MAERPILFSAPMVRALLAGTKTQTRRAFRDQPPPGVRVGFVPGRSTTPYGVPGDRLWVREAWKWNGGMSHSDAGKRFSQLYVTYAADGLRRTIVASGDEKVPEQPPQRDGGVYSLRDAPEDFCYDGENTYMDRLSRWWDRKIPSIHMPRWASRITLEITEVRVERLQSISFEDALAEGVADYRSLIASECTEGETTDECARRLRWPQRQYALLWDYINGIGAWDSNPWCWAVSFRLLAPNT